VKEATVTKIERLLMPNSTERPDCRCGAEMEFAAAERAGDGAEIRIYRCATCEHEMRLAVWIDAAFAKQAAHDVSTALLRSAAEPGTIAGITAPLTSDGGPR
jgi:hypothetical protein